jgi:HTH-type transcriptional repressor of NAD biosynthesis genes
MKKRAVIVGKFHPFHKGHSLLIETAESECDEVYVLVCDNDKYTIPADIRRVWIEKTHPKVRVMIIPDIDKDDDSTAWAKHTISFLGFVPEVAYTSEGYGKTWSEEMRCIHRCVDINRNIVPISATKIRSDVVRNFEYLPDAAREDLVRKIVIVGAESTGTTTLSEMLANQLACPWTVELGRYYSLSLSTQSEPKWNDYDFLSIAKQQQEYEDSIARHSDGIMVCDTNAFATKIWQQRYMGYTTPEVEKIAYNASADLYVLTGDEIPFVQDGLRDGEHIRHEMHKQFISELEKLSTPFITVRGTRKDRLNKAMVAIKKLPKKRITLNKE